ncbi:MAG: NADH-quinone oxidoreductase subunit C, partial [Opitutaceae bacterium]
MSATVDVTTALKEKFPSATPRASLDHAAVNLPAGDVFAALSYLRDEQAFDLLTDVSAIDWAEGVSPRFTVVYHLFSATRHDYLRVATDCASDDEPVVASVVALWAGANWHERETY